MIAMKTKKGLSLAAGASAVLLLIIIGVTAVVGITILNQVVTSDASSIWVNSTVSNSSLGIQQITQQMTLVGLIVVMAIVIGLLWSSFGGFIGGRGAGI